MKTYYFAKLNINQNIFSSLEKFEDIKNIYIPQLLKSFADKNRKNRIYSNSKESKNWTITDVTNLSENIIVGNLALTKPEEKVKIVEEVRTAENKEDTTYIAPFIYIIDKEYIAFHTNNNIKMDAFPEAMQNVLNHCVPDNLQDKIGTVEIRLLTYTSEFEKMILTKKVRKLKFSYLSPNDPRTNKAISDLFDNNRLKKGTWIGQNEEEGIDIKESDGSPKGFLGSFLNHVKNGWGKLEANIGEKGSKEKITTDEFARTEQLDNNDPAYIDKVANKIERQISKQEKSENDRYRNNRKK